MRRLYSSQFYKNLPTPFQNSLVSLKGVAYSTLRGGRRFTFFQKELLDNERLDSCRLSEIQLGKLKELLMHAYENVPFYRKQFDDVGFNPKGLTSLDDIKRIPILEKETLRKHPDQFTASNVSKRILFKGSTSGSTGTPLSLKMDRELIQREHAFVWRQYRWAGCPVNGCVACFRGDMIVPVEQKKPPYWRFDKWSNEIWFSSYHISMDTVPAYIEALRKYQPDLIYAYPSSIALIARCALEMKLPISIDSLRGIVTSSETLQENDKALLQNLFNVRVFDWYGAFERVVFIGTCEFGRYHIFPDYGVTELIPMEHPNCELMYEIIGTGFMNSYMPLIRYRTGDTVTARGGTCECGRPFPLVESINGRLDDMIVTTDGRKIGRLDHIFKGVDHVKMSQIIQERLDEIKIVVVVDPLYGEPDREAILANVAERLGAEMKVQIDVVPDIPRLPSGKFRGVISYLN